MGWFHDVFGFSSQPAVEVLNDAGRTIWDNNVVNSIGRGLESLGAKKLGRMVALPSWDELGKPGEAFVTEFDQHAGVLPPSWRQYAAPVVGAALSFVNPFAGAAFTTAYNAGKMQQQQKGMDWGKVARDAGINFGTAAISQGFKNWGNQSNNVNKMNVSTSTPYGTTPTGYSGTYTVPGTQGAVPGATSAATGASVPAGTTTNALGAFSTGPAPAPNPYNAAAFGATEAMQPAANAVQASGVANPFRQAAAQVGSNIVNDQLTQSLAPELATPISGTEPSSDSFLSLASGLNTSPLNSFGGAELLKTPESYSQEYINSDAYQQAMQRISANNYLQQRDLMDRFRSAGQTDLNTNPRYSAFVNDINNSTIAAREQYAKDAELANKYQQIKLYNDLTDEQMMEYIKDPTMLPADVQPMFASFAPMFNL